MIEPPKDITGDISALVTDEAILEEAVALPAAERPRFLAEMCRGNSERRTRLEALVRGHEEAGEFLKLPAVTRPPIIPREQAGDVIDQYRLVERIGDGGSGVVWAADQAAPLRRKVALKIIKGGMSTRALVARFDTERQVLALMDHPHIARVYDAGMTGTGRPYFVMELVAGVPITRYCDEERSSLRQRLELFLRVCDAVQHAHQKGILHRDLKPSNILVAKVDDEPSPKVIDFGIAKALQASETGEQGTATSELLLGTPAYMSPEAAAGSEHEIDTRSDIYTLGVLLYELLTGSLPIDARALMQGTIAEMRQRLLTVVPEPPSVKIATLPTEALRQRASLRGTTPALWFRQLRGDLDAIIARCLAKERNQRYESVGALSAEIRRHLRDEPVAAHPSSFVYVAGKAMRRHRGVFAAGTAVFVAIVLGGAVSLWQAVRATQAERAESRLRKQETALRLKAEAQELATRRRAYAADMNLLQQALAQDNLGQAIKLLQRYEPQGKEPDLRGWEWRYLWQLCRSEATAELAHMRSPVSSLAISDDGAWVAIGQEDGGIAVLRHLATQESIELRLGSGATRVACSPRAPLLAILYVGAGEGRRTQIRLWHLGRREVVGEWAVAGTPGSVQFTEDGKALVTATAGRAGEIAYWDVPTGRKVTTLGEAGGTLFALSRDGEALAREQVRDGRAWIQVVEKDGGRERWSAEASDETVSALAFSADGRLLASAAGNAETGIRIWDARTGQALRTLHGHRTYVSARAFTPDGRRLVSASKDQTVRLWDPATGELRRTLRGHRLEIHSLALTPNGQGFATGAKDGVVLLWNAATPPQRTYTRLGEPVVGWGFTPDEDAVVSVDVAGRVTRRSGAEFSVVEPLFDAGPMARWARPTGGGSQPIGAHFARKRTLLAVADDEGNTKVFDWQQRRLLATLPTKSGRIIFGGFRNEGRTLLLGHTLAGTEADLHEWDIATVKVIHSWDSKEPNAQQFALAADGALSVVRASSGVVSVLDLASSSERLISEPALMVNSLAVSPDASLIAATSGVGWARVWRRSDARLAAELSGFILGVHSVTFTPRNDRVITGSGDQEAIRIWDVNTWEPVLTMPAQGSRFGGVTVSLQERWIGSRSAFGRLHIWRAPSWAEIAGAKRGE